MKYADSKTIEAIREEARAFAHAAVEGFREAKREKGMRVPQYGTLEPLWDAYYQGYLSGNLTAQFGARDPKPEAAKEVKK